jgi:hypothetical protein
MSSYDSYGEDIAGQAYSSYADTPGDAGGNDNFVPPTTIRTTDPTDLIDVAPPPSQRLNLIDRLGGGIRSIKDYFGDPDNQAGIFSGSVGAALFGPLAGIITGLAGRRFASRNNNLLTGINTIDYDNTLPFILPEAKPFRGSGNVPPIVYDTDISDLMANKITDYKIGDISDKTFDAAINSGFNPYTGEELKPGEAEDLKNERNKGTGINTIDTTMIV